MQKVIGLFTLLFLIGISACFKGLPKIDQATDWKVQKIPASSQINDGDATAGWNYLITGNYIGSGIPYDFIKEKMSGQPDEVLKREGRNANIRYDYNLVDTQNGVAVMNGNCLTCHGGFINDEFIPGLGNSFMDFSEKNTFQFKVLSFLIKRKFKKDSPEREAFSTYEQANKDALPYILCPNPGVNPAFRLEEGYMKARDPQTLEMGKEKNFKQKKYTLASDTPPWWNVKKKNALYYNGMGRGSFTKLLMQASTQGVKDSTEARSIHNNFKDILAYLNQIEAPKYPGKIDQLLALEGKKLFEENCSKCHGTYGNDETYPNKLVSLQVVKTDPYYARYFTTGHLSKWYNESWFATSSPASKIVPSDGYIAPPLDGVWATAPYLHNGSIPTLEDLLNSRNRPRFWNRSWKNDDFDYQKVGWNYLRLADGKDEHTYDTTLPGYGNMGHYFGDDLNSDERAAVIEYLKTL